jgi:hypothetical protein
MRNLVLSLSLAALAAVLVRSTANAENLDVNVITVKKFTVLENGGVKIPAGTDSYWDFLEITNNDDSRLPAVITGVESYGLNAKGCILMGGAKFPISLPYKTTLEFTIRQGCTALGGIGINIQGGQLQQYGPTDPLRRLASPVFQVRWERSN